MGFKAFSWAWACIAVRRRHQAARRDKGEDVRQLLPDYGELGERVDEQVAQLEAVEKNIRRERAERAAALAALQRIQTTIDRQPQRGLPEGGLHGWLVAEGVAGDGLRGEYADLERRVGRLRAELRDTSDSLRQENAARAEEAEKRRSVPGDLASAAGVLPLPAVEGRSWRKRYDDILERFGNHTAELRRLREALQLEWRGRRHLELALHRIEETLEERSGAGTILGGRNCLGPVATRTDLPRAGDALGERVDGGALAPRPIFEAVEPRMASPAEASGTLVVGLSKSRVVEDGLKEAQCAPCALRAQLEQLAGELRSVQDVVEREVAERRRVECWFQRVHADLRQQLVQNGAKRSATVDAQQFARRREAVELLRKEHAELSWRLGMQAAELAQRLEVQARALTSIRWAVEREPTGGNGFVAGATMPVTRSAAEQNASEPSVDLVPVWGRGVPVDQVVSELRKIREGIQLEAAKRAQEGSALRQAQAELSRRIEKSAAETHAALAARLAERVQAERALEARCDQLTTRLEEQERQLDVALGVAGRLARLMGGRIWFEGGGDQEKTASLTLHLGSQRVAEPPVPREWPPRAARLADRSSGGKPTSPGDRRR